MTHNRGVSAAPRGPADTLQPHICRTPALLLPLKGPLSFVPRPHRQDRRAFASGLLKSRCSLGSWEVRDFVLHVSGRTWP